MALSNHGRGLGPAAPKVLVTLLERMDDAGIIEYARMVFDPEAPARKRTQFAVRAVDRQGTPHGACRVLTAAEVFPWAVGQWDRLYADDDPRAADPAVKAVIAEYTETGDTWSPAEIAALLSGD